MNIKKGIKICPFHKIRYDKKKGCALCWVAAAEIYSLSYAGKLNPTPAKTRLEAKKEALDILEEVLYQACERDGKGDSRALSAYARGLRYLSKEARFSITEECGRRVIGKFLSPEVKEKTKRR